MKKITLILLILFLFSCGGSKKRHVVTKKRNKTTKTVKSNTKTPKTVTTYPRHTNTNSSALISNIISNAEAYKGVKYKYGGTTKKGMDCSGLLYTAFSEENISLPRTTGQLSTYGNWIDLKDVKEGDLLFFATKKNSRKVNHVGLVTSSRLGRVEFIHSSTSKGVIKSLLSEKYWYFAFVQARRVF